MLKTYSFELHIPTGVKQCIHRALQTSGISPQQVDYVNAHATSTQAGDMVGGHCAVEVPQALCVCVYVRAHARLKLWAGAGLVSWMCSRLGSRLALQNVQPIHCWSLSFFILAGRVPGIE